MSKGCNRAVRYVDQFIQKVQIEEQKKLQEFKRELGFKPVLRKPPGRGGGVVR
jgi:hypothetical protein